MHWPEPVLQAQNEPVSQCLFLLHSASRPARSPARQAALRRQLRLVLMLCLDCLSFCYATGLGGGAAPVWPGDRLGGGVAPGRIGGAQVLPAPLNAGGLVTSSYCAPHSKVPEAGCGSENSARIAYADYRHSAFAFGRPSTTL